MGSTASLGLGDWGLFPRVTVWLLQAKPLLQLQQVLFLVMVPVLELGGHVNKVARWLDEALWHEAG